MTWKEFKADIERQGVKDDTRVMIGGRCRGSGSGYIQIREGSYPDEVDFVYRESAHEYQSIQERQ